MSFWTDENVAEMKKRWAAGESAGFIAKAMNAPSRSAIIGKVRRLGLPKRQSTAHIIQVRKKVAPKVALRVRQAKAMPVFEAQPLPPPRVVPATALHLTLMDLTNHTCKFSFGDPKSTQFSFCGLPTLDGSSYCAEHHRACYSTIRTENAKRKQTGARHHTHLRFERWAA